MVDMRWKLLAVVAVVAISCGGEPAAVPVPDVTDLALPEAREHLSDVGLEVEEVDASGRDRGVFSPGNWSVVSQDPDGGVEVESGATVVVVVVNVRDDDEEPEEVAVDEEPEPAAEDEPAEEPRSSSLEADVSAGASGLRIVSEADVHDCTVDLNAGIIRSGYTTDLAMLTGGEAYVVPWSELTSRDGERFNYGSHRPEMVTISCEDDDGNHRFDTWGW